MKRLKTISKELNKKLGVDNPCICENDEHWKYYCSISGFYNSGETREYYGITIMHSKRSGKKEIYQKEQEGCQERTEGCSVQDCAQTAGEEK